MNHTQANYSPGYLEQQSGQGGPLIQAIRLVFGNEIGWPALAQISRRFVGHHGHKDFENAGLADNLNIALSLFCYRYLPTLIPYYLAGHASIATITRPRPRMTTHGIPKPLFFNPPLFVEPIVCARPAPAKLKHQKSKYIAQGYSSPPPPSIRTHTERTKTAHHMASVPTARCQIPTQPRPLRAQESCPLRAQASCHLRAQASRSHPARTLG